VSEIDDAHDSAAPAGVAIARRVRVFPRTNAEAHGVVIDDYGDAVGVPVEVGGIRIVGPARRWAVQLDDDTLVFVDGTQVVAE
jgi:hypothetical protein